MRRGLVALAAALVMVIGPGARAQDPHAQDPHAQDPHGGGGARGGGNPGVFEPPPDGSEETAELPAGTIAIDLRDPDDLPIKGVVTIGILRNSVAKGESRERMVRDTDEKGRLVLSGLDTGSGIAYRVSSTREGNGTFAVAPFQLGARMGTRAVLHVYPVTSDLDKALIVAQAIVYVELKDDRIQIQQALTIFNFGRTAWVPENVTLVMPQGYTALTGQQGMTDVGIDPIEKKGAKIRGTFSPGRHDIEFRWQLPFSGDRDAAIEAPMPPHVAAIRVITPATKDIHVAVPGFPAPEAKGDGQGQRVLITERQLKREDAPLASVKVELHDLPVPGPGRLVATGIAGGAIVIGLWLGRRRRSSASSKPLRQRLLDELVQLERAYVSKLVGPRTYASERRLLLDQLAATWVQKS